MKFPEITEWLNKQGKSPTGLPLFRLTWSDGETEWRYGVFREYFGEIFIREEYGTKLVPKYPYIKSRWILEMWFPPEISMAKELPHSRQGSYEPLFVFQDKNGNELLVAMRPVEYIVNFALHGPRMSSNARASEDKIEEEIREAKEMAEFEDKIDCSVISSLLHSKEAIVRP